jgi:hypothetical protein
MSRFGDPSFLDLPANGSTFYLSTNPMSRQAEPPMHAVAGFPGDHLTSLMNEERRAMDEVGEEIVFTVVELNQITTLADDPAASASASAIRRWPGYNDNAPIYHKPCSTALHEYRTDFILRPKSKTYRFACRQPLENTGHNTSRQLSSLTKAFDVWPTSYMYMREEWSEKRAKELGEKRATFQTSLAKLPFLWHIPQWEDLSASPQQGFCCFSHLYFPEKRAEIVSHILRVLRESKENKDTNVDLSGWTEAMSDVELEAAVEHLRYPAMKKELVNLFPTPSSLSEEMNFKMAVIQSSRGLGGLGLTSKEAKELYYRSNLKLTIGGSMWEELVKHCTVQTYSSSGQDCFHFTCSYSGCGAIYGGLTVDGLKAMKCPPGELPWSVLAKAWECELIEEVATFCFMSMIIDYVVDRKSFGDVLYNHYIENFKGKHKGIYSFNTHSCFVD